MFCSEERAIKLATDATTAIVLSLFVLWAIIPELQSVTHEPIQHAMLTTATLITVVTSIMNAGVDKFMVLIVIMSTGVIFRDDIVEVLCVVIHTFFYGAMFVGTSGFMLFLITLHGSDVHQQLSDPQAVVQFGEVVQQQRATFGNYITFYASKILKLFTELLAYLVNAEKARLEQKQTIVRLTGDNSLMCKKLDDTMKRNVQLEGMNTKLAAEHKVVAKKYETTANVSDFQDVTVQTLTKQKRRLEYDMHVMETEHKQVIEEQHKIMVEIAQQRNEQFHHTFKALVGKDVINNQKTELEEAKAATEQENIKLLQENTELRHQILTTGEQRIKTAFDLEKCESDLQQTVTICEQLMDDKTKLVQRLTAAEDSVDYTVGKNLQQTDEIRFLQTTIQQGNKTVEALQMQIVDMSTQMNALLQYITTLEQAMQDQPPDSVFFE
jgi:chromosome segregation ATPase